MAHWLMKLERPSISEALQRKGELMSKRVREPADRRAELDRIDVTRLTRVTASPTNVVKDLSAWPIG
jgi:hypothetical protein